MFVEVKEVCYSTIKDVFRGGSLQAARHWSTRAATRIAVEDARQTAIYDACSLSYEEIDSRLHEKQGAIGVRQRRGKRSRRRKQPWGNPSTTCRNTANFTRWRLQIWNKGDGETLFRWKLIQRATNHHPYRAWRQGHMALLHVLYTSTSTFHIPQGLSCASKIETPILIMSEQGMTDRRVNRDQRGPQIWQKNPVVQTALKASPSRIDFTEF